MAKGVGKVMKAIFRVAVIPVGLVAAEPAVAGQWVYGKVAMVEDYAAYDSAFGVLVTLQQTTWDASDGNGEPLGQSVCTERLNLGATSHGMDENVKNRMFSMLLTAATTQRAVGLYIDTTTRTHNTFCRVVIVSYGREVG